MKRLYVLVSNDLDPIYGAVQGTHVVAQYMLDNHSDLKWKNGYLIMLSGDLNKLRYKLKMKEIEFSEFLEPDLDNKLTAIAVLGNDQIFKNYKLL